jgi:hypothetical protein
VEDGWGRRRGPWEGPDGGGRRGATGAEQGGAGRKQAGHGAAEAGGVGRGGARWGAAEDAARARRREELPLLFRVAVRACAREEDDEVCWPARVDSVALDPICLGALLCVGCGFNGRFEGSRQPAPCKQQGTGSQSG